MQRMADNRRNIQAARGAEQLAKANLLLAQRLQVTSEALKMTAALLRAAEEKVTELQSTPAAQNNGTGPLLVKTEAQAAADTIHKLENKLYQNTTYIIRLKNKLTRYRLQRRPYSRMRPNYNNYVKHED